jgi:hypothetical protein
MSDLVLDANPAAPICKRHPFPCHEQWAKGPSMNTGDQGRRPHRRKAPASTRRTALCIRDPGRCRYTPGKSECAPGAGQALGRGPGKWGS